MWGEGGITFSPLVSASKESYVSVIIPEPDLDNKMIDFKPEHNIIKWDLGRGEVFCM